MKLSSSSLGSVYLVNQHMETFSQNKCRPFSVNPNETSLSISVTHIYMTPARDPKQQKNMESWKRNHGRCISCRRIVEEELWRRRLGGGSSWRHGGGVVEVASWRGHGGEQHLYIYVWCWRSVMQVIQLGDVNIKRVRTYDGGGRSCDPPRPHPHKAHTYDGGGRSCDPNGPYSLKPHERMAVGNVIQLSQNHSKCAL